MRVSKLTTLKEAFFDYPNDPDKARFKIGMLTPGEQETVESKASRIVFGEQGQNYELDTTLAGGMRAAAALKGWENVFDDEAGSDVLPFTAKNKTRLLKGIPGFKGWVLEKLKELEEAFAAELEAERKNLSS